MPPRPARKPLNTYHHGDLRDALVQAALAEVELGGPEAISISALAKKLGVSQPAPYKHFADREALLVAVTAEAFRQFSAMLREQIRKPSKRSKLSRYRAGHARFRSSTQRHLPADVRVADHGMRAQGQRASRGRRWRPSICCWNPWKRRRSDCCANAARLKVWAALHGVVMLAEQGLLTGQLANVSREELVEDIVEQTKLALSVAIEAASRNSR